VLRFAKDGTYAERDATGAADDRDKLVEIIGADPGEDHAGRDGDGAEDVLLPLDLRVRLARPREEAVLHDADGREQLERRREQDGERVEELMEEEVALVGVSQVA
jgi:hypothetical protein